MEFDRNYFSILWNFAFLKYYTPAIVKYFDSAFNIDETNIELVWALF